MDLKLKELREAERLSQGQVAAEVGCSVPVYNRYENGRRQPSLEMLVTLADYYGTSTDYILGREVSGAMKLSRYEQTLIEAARKADDRAKEDVLLFFKARLVHDQDPGQD